MKWKVSVIAVCFILLTIIGVDSSNLFIEKKIKRWDVENKLEWNDFKADTDFLDPYSAAIWSDIHYSFPCNDSLGFDIYAYQKGHNSWKKDEDTIDQGLLAHEQYHFNLTEAYARKLKQRLAEYENPCSESEGEIIDLITDIRAELSYEQDKYDEETRHSQDRIKQKEWQEKIDLMLVEYSGFDYVYHDIHSGLSIGFPGKFKKEIPLSKNSNRARMQVSYQDSTISFLLTLSQPSETILDSTLSNFQKYADEDKIKILESKRKDIIGIPAQSLFLKDREGFYHHFLFFIKNGFLVSAITTCQDSSNEELDEKQAKIAKVFENSIKFSTSNNSSGLVQNKLYDPGEKVGVLYSGNSPLLFGSCPRQDSVKKTIDIAFEVTDSIKIADIAFVNVLLLKKTVDARGQQLQKEAMNLYYQPQQGVNYIQLKDTFPEGTYAIMYGAAFKKDTSKIYQLEKKTCTLLIER